MGFAGLVWLARQCLLHDEQKIPAMPVEVVAAAKSVFAVPVR